MDAKIKILFTMLALLLMAFLASSCSSHLRSNSTGISTVAQQLDTAAEQQQQLTALGGNHAHPHKNYDHSL